METLWHLNPTCLQNRPHREGTFQEPSIFVKGYGDSIIRLLTRYLRYATSLFGLFWDEQYLV